MMSFFIERLKIRKNKNEIKKTTRATKMLKLLILATLTTFIFMSVKCTCPMAGVYLTPVEATLTLSSTTPTCKKLFCMFFFVFRLR